MAEIFRDKDNVMKWTVNGVLEFILIAGKIYRVKEAVQNDYDEVIDEKPVTSEIDKSHIGI